MKADMLQRLKSFLGALPDNPGMAEPDTDDPRVAAAVLMLLIADADGVRVEAESAMLRQALAETYSLSPPLVEKIVAVSEDARSEAIDLFSFTSVLNRALDEAGKVEFIGLLWEMVYADGEMHELEDNLVWRIAELIGVSARERVLMRRRVRDAFGIEGD